jgi:hypothetical protein
MDGTSLLEGREAAGQRTRLPPIPSRMRIIVPETVAWEKLFIVAFIKEFIV